MREGFGGWRGDGVAWSAVVFPDTGSVVCGGVVAVAWRGWPMVTCPSPTRVGREGVGSE